jgi:hypothetical protein
MKNDPLLRGPKVYTEDGQTYRIVVNGGLHYIRGNSAPYFSLTYSQDRQERGAWRDDSGGAGHDIILKFYPELADLAALHLSDINGAPVHDAGNGWYWLAGALDGAGERFHGGNSEQHFPLPEDKRDPAKPWITTEYRHPAPSECLDIFARYVRITRAEAERILEDVRTTLGPEQDSQLKPPHTATDYKRARAALSAHIEAMRPRWKREAQACIAKHNLHIYGDHWEAK